MIDLRIPRTRGDLGPGRATPVNQALEGWRQALREAGYNAPVGLVFHPSRLLQPGGDRAAAKAACEQALAHEPDQPEVLAVMIALLQSEGRSQEGLELRRRMIAQRVSQWSLDDAARASCVEYLYAGVAGERGPGRAPEAYVTALFDDYARRFDEHLVSGLDYRGPEIIFEALVACGAIPGDAPTGGADGLRVLDLGCGTGLVGKVLRPYAARLDGVDLSSAMIARAHELGIYDTLAQSDLIRYLDDCASVFDLAAAGEVLNYFGEIGPVLRAVRERLAPGGRFVFTLEQGAGEGYRLRSSGRYEHHRDYATGAVASAGYELERFEEVALRKQDGESVMGFACVARRPG